VDPPARGRALHQTDSEGTVIDVLSSLALLAAIGSPLVFAGYLALATPARRLSTLVRVSGAATLIALAFYYLVQGIIEPGARIDGTTAQQLEFAVGTVAVTLVVTLAGAGLVTLASIAGRVIASDVVARITGISIAAVWLIIIYVGFVVSGFQSGFGICLPPATDVGGTCETSPG
jgi:hypothetical protein